MSRPTQERFTIAEFADMLGFPVTALAAIIEKNRSAIKKPFYNISQLAERWAISRAQVYNILRESEFKVLNTASKGSEGVKTGVFRLRWSRKLSRAGWSACRKSRLDHIPILWVCCTHGHR